MAKFQAMLATQYVPSLIGGSCENGNKELSMSEALINIGVFNDDRTTFELGVTFTMSPKSWFTSAYVCAISCQRCASPMLAACSFKLVYWPPGISCR